MTIEETWLEVEGALLGVHEHICYSPQPGCPRERDPRTIAAIKAAMLTVLDKAESHVYRHDCHDPKEGPVEIYESIKLPALRRRIQELGK